MLSYPGGCVQTDKSGEPHNRYDKRSIQYDREILQIKKEDLSANVRFALDLAPLHLQLHAKSCLNYLQALSIDQT